MFRVIILISLVLLASCSKKPAINALDTVDAIVEDLPCKYSAGEIEHLHGVSVEKSTQQPANGLLCDYWDNGSLFRGMPYKNGRLDGRAKVYYYYDVILEDTSYKNGIADGLSKVYYSDGSWRETPYKNGNRDGVSKEYYASGALQAEEPYENDSLNGIVKVYYENGVLHSKGSYKNGEIDGTIRQYDEDGRLVMKLVHKNGRFISIACTNESQHSLKMDSNSLDASCDNWKTSLTRTGPSY